MSMTACHRPAPQEVQTPSETCINALVADMQSQFPTANQERMTRGIRQMASLWHVDEDGTEEEMVAFVKENYLPNEEERTTLLLSLSQILEHLYESADQLTVNLLKPTQLTNAGEPTQADWIMSGYSASAHIQDDLYANKIAFLTILNFPFYTLEEKNTFGGEWTRQQWAEARLGDVFTSRVPANVQATMWKACADAENYIADYNIYMGCLRTEDGRQLFPNDMILLSHWNLRDELKANYAGGRDSQEKQEMIYEVMQRIVRQQIPEVVINSNEYNWQPYTNTVEMNGEWKESTAERDVRYQKILDIFHAMQQVDLYSPQMPTGIIRNFEGDIEIPADEVERIFTEFITSDRISQIAADIRTRLDRDLRPYDIWYDGFKARSSMNEDHLTAQTRALYPTPQAYQQDMPRLLQKLGFEAQVAQDICSHIIVEPARGSGHAWPCMGRNELTRLRTRIAGNGMDYKGYNIAVHEMGHNVEEVVSMYYMDYYMLHGIPNTGFTEASAFLFQQRDLQLLGYKRSTLDDETEKDTYWGMYEIMGVSLVDMKMWQWLYDHPTATANQLKEATLQIAAQVWNTYYYPLLGEKDCVLLAIYSHMVNSPMYLPNYPIGHLVQFELEKYLADKSDTELAESYIRWYKQGRLTPLWWMTEAVGHNF